MRCPRFLLPVTLGLALLGGFGCGGAAPASPAAPAAGKGDSLAGQRSSAALTVEGPQSFTDKDALRVRADFRLYKAEFAGLDPAAAKLKVTWQRAAEEQRLYEIPLAQIADETFDFAACWADPANGTYCEGFFFSTPTFAAGEITLRLYFEGLPGVSADAAVVTSRIAVSQAPTSVKVSNVKICRSLNAQWLRSGVLPAGVLHPCESPLRPDAAGEYALPRNLRGYYFIADVFEVSGEPALTVSTEGPGGPVGQVAVYHPGHGRNLWAWQQLAALAPHATFITRLQLAGDEDDAAQAAGGQTLASVVVKTAR